MLKQCYHIRLEFLNYILECENPQQNNELFHIDNTTLLEKINKLQATYNKKIINDILTQNIDEFKRHINNFISEYNYGKYNYGKDDKDIDYYYRNYDYDIKTDDKKYFADSTNFSDFATDAKKHININNKIIKIKNIPSELIKAKFKQFESLHNKNATSNIKTSAASFNNDNNYNNNKNNNGENEERKQSYEESNKNDDMDSYFYDVVVVMMQNMEPNKEYEISYLYNVILNILDNMFKKIEETPTSCLLDIFEIYTQAHNDNNNIGLDLIIEKLNKYIPGKITSNYIYLLNNNINKIYIETTPEILLKIDTLFKNLNNNMSINNFAKNVILVRILDFLDKNDYLLKDLDDSMDRCCVCFKFSGTVNNVLATIMPEKSFYDCIHNELCIDCFVKLNKTNNYNRKKVRCPICKAKP